MVLIVYIRHCDVSRGSPSMGRRHYMAYNETPMKGIDMDLDDILAMSPEEFAKSWNESDDIVHTCMDVLEEGVKKFKPQPTIIFDL